VGLAASSAQNNMAAVSFRPNGPDGMWLISGESVRRVEQDSRHDPEHGKLPVEPDGGLTQCSQYRV